MRLVPFVLLPALLSAADLRIDHVTIAGRDLAQIRAALDAVGIPTVYGGAHANSVTEMALTSFPDGSYLEAITLQPNSDPAAVERHEWARFLKTPGMPAAWALQAPNLDAATASLRTAGVPLGQPVRAGRRRPDGKSLEWETVSLGAETRGTFFPFLIHDVTPRDLRAFPSGQPTNRDFRGVARVVVAVRNLDSAIARYRSAFGLPAAVRQTGRDFGAELATLGDFPVVLAQPLAADSWLAARIEQFGEGPCAFVLAAAGRPPAAAAQKSRWFGRDIAWFDPGKLGLRLGVQ
jgi:catechol 2,3-dioxygenase-like lactoylglutathione lyase family enzyme